MITSGRRRIFNQTTEAGAQSPRLGRLVEEGGRGGMGVGGREQDSGHPPPERWFCGSIPRVANSLLSTTQGSPPPAPPKPSASAHPRMLFLTTAPSLWSLGKPPASDIPIYSSAPNFVYLLLQPNLGLSSAQATFSAPLSFAS